MERMFLLTLDPHETSPPSHEHMESLRRLLSRLGTLHSFAMSRDGMFLARLCSRLPKNLLEEGFLGMMVNVELEEQNGECHDCRTKKVA